MDALGINIFNIIIYTVLFIILYFVLRKYLAKPITDMLDQRERDIAAVHDQKIQLHAVEVENQTYKEKLEAKIIAENKAAREEIIKSARDEKAKILEAAQKEAAVILANANGKLAQDRKTLEAQTEDKVKATVTKVLKEVYGQDKKEIDRSLIQKALNEL